MTRRAVAIALGVSAIGHAVLWTLDPHPYVMLGDTIGYLQTMLEPVPSLKAPLGYALVLAVPLLVVTDLQTIVLVQVVAVLATALLAALLVRRALAPPVAILAGEGEAAGEGAASEWVTAATLVAVALWPRHVYYAHTLLAECLTIFWITCLAFLLLGTARRNGEMLAAGLALGAAMLTRSAAVGLLPGALAVAWLVPPARPAPARGDLAGPTGVVRRRHRRRVTDALLLAAGAAILLVPYAGMNRLLRGDFTVTAFDGWTLFGTVAAHVDVEAIEEPRLRALFAAREDVLTELSPSALRWSARSPAVALDSIYRASYDDPDVRALLAHEGAVATVAHLLRQPEHPEIRANRVLRQVALRTIAAHPLAYARGALERFGAYWLGRERYPTHFQSLAGVGAHANLPRLRHVLRTRYDTALPEVATGLLERWRYTAYDLRALWLVPIALGLIAAARRGLWDGPTRLLAGGVLLAVSFSASTAAVAEIYDRYTVPTDALVIVAAVAAGVVIHRFVRG